LSCRLDYRFSSGLRSAHSDTD